MRSFLGLVGFTLLAALNVVGVAHAQTTAQKFEDAVELFSADDCAKALPLFREVFAESNSPNARLYIARCLQKNGDLPGAYNEMKATVAEATQRAVDEPKYAETRDAAAAELAVLEPSIATVVIALADAPDDASAEANGLAIPIGKPTAVAPGTVAIVVTAAGWVTVNRTVEIEAGQTKTVALTLQPAPAGEPVGAEPDAGEGGFNGLIVAGIAVYGLGAASLVVFAITGVMAESEFDDLVALCNDTTCPPSEADRVAHGRTLTTSANVSAVIGALALGAGTVLTVLGALSEGDDTTAIVPLLGPGYVGLSGSF